MSPDVREVLGRARQLVETGWPDEHCPSTAISAVADRQALPEPRRADLVNRAHEVFTEVNDLPDVDEPSEPWSRHAVAARQRRRIWSWNDAPGRRKAEVLAAFDRTLAT